MIKAEHNPVSIWKLLILCIFLFTFSKYAQAQLPGAGNALSFDGTDDYVALPNEANFDFSTQVTVECWVKIPLNAFVGGTNWQGIVTKGDNSWRIHRNNNTRKIGLGLNQFATPNYRELVGTTDIDDGKWHHIALTYNGAVMALYIDGIIDGTLNATVPINTNNFEVRIGSNAQTGARYLNGEVDEIRIWNVGRTPDQIRENMCRKFSGTLPTGLVSYYRFDQSTGTVLTDAKGSNNGTLTNFGFAGTSNWIPSGASIGDVSAYTLGGTSVTLTDGDVFTANNFGGMPATVHIYKVREMPNFTGIVNNTFENLETSRYFGVFMPRGVGTANITYDYTNNTNLNGSAGEARVSLARRDNGNAQSWYALPNLGAVTNTTTNTVQIPGQGTGTGEFIAGFRTPPTLPLLKSGAGDALRLDGVNDVVTVTTPALAIPKNNESFTIETWFYADSLDNFGLVGWGDFNTTNGANYIKLGNDGTNGTITHSWQGNDITATITEDFSRSWNHLAVSYDAVAGTRTIYLNGVVVATQLVGIIPAIPNTNNFTIGNVNATGVKFLQGQIDEVRIWNVARTQTQIRDNLVQKFTTTLPAGLVAYYNFDEGTGTLANDIVGFGQGTLSNFDFNDNSNRVPSGAFIGDISAYTFGGTTATLTDGDSFTANNFTGAPTGVYVYKVRTPPNTSAVASDLTGITTPYFGVFNIGGSTVDVSYNYTSNASVNGNANEADARLATRTSNAATIWSLGNVSNTNVNTTAKTVTGTKKSSGEYTVAFRNRNVSPDRHQPGSGNTLFFDGINDFISLPNESDYDFTNQMTVECWIKVNAFTRDWQAVVTKGDNAWRLHRFAKSNNMSFALNTFNKTGYRELRGTTNVNDGKWHHVAGVFDGTTMTLYVDGLVDGTLNATGVTINNKSHPVLIGENAQATKRYFNGQIDEVRIWNVARTQAEIREKMCSKFPRNVALPAGLFTYFRFEEGAGSIINDIGSGNNGALNNFNFTGNSNWLISGAFIGDISAYTYGGSTISINDGDVFTANNFSPAPSGVHVYKVREAPNSTLFNNTVFNILEPSRYFGIFVVRGDKVDAIYNYTPNTNVNGNPNEKQARFAKRPDNTGTTWTNSINALMKINTTTKILSSKQQGTSEYIIGFIPALTPPAPKPAAGSALSFDGSKPNVVAVPIVPTIQNDDVTIEGWFNPRGGTGNQILTYVGNPMTNGYGIGLSYATPTPTVTIPLGGVGVLTTNANVPLNQWSHITAVRRSGVWEVYVNSIKQTVNNDTAIPIAPTVTDPVTIGGTPTGTQIFNGIVDEIKIWDTPRTPMEIRENMTVKLPPNNLPPNLIAYYNFDEGTGTKVNDLVQGNNGTLNNFTFMEISNWVVSGAPLGNASVTNFNITPATTLTLPNPSNPANTVLIGNITGNPDGVILIRNDQTPNVTNLNGTPVDNISWTVFPVGGNNPTFEINYNYTGSPLANQPVQVLTRPSTSTPQWTPINTNSDTKNSALIAQNQVGGEFILAPDPSSLGTGLLLRGKAGSRQVFLNWKSLFGAVKYNVYFFSARQPIRFYASTEDTLITVNGLNNAEIYTFRITAVDAFDNESISSNNLQLRPSIVLASEEENTIAGLILYPNPVEETVALRLGSQVRGKVKVSMLNMTGQLVLQQDLDTSQQVYEIDVRHIASGVYFLQLIAEEKVFIKRLIKK
jgi:hypothetical protein